MNQIAEEITFVRENICGHLPSLQTVEPYERYPGRPVSAFYDPVPRSFGILENYTGKQMHMLVKDHKAKGLCSTDHKNHIMRHEVAHAMVDYIIRTTPDWKTRIDKIKEKMATIPKEEYGQTLSVLAFETPYECISESYCCYMDGNNNLFAQDILRTLFGG